MAIVLNAKLDFSDKIITSKLFVLNNAMKVKLILFIFMKWYNDLKNIFRIHYLINVNYVRHIFLTVFHALIKIIA